MPEGKLPTVLEEKNFVALNHEFLSVRTFAEAIEWSYGAISHFRKDTSRPKGQSNRTNAAKFSLIQKRGLKH